MVDIEIDGDSVTVEPVESVDQETGEVVSVEFDDSLTVDQGTALLASTVAEQCEQIVNTLDGCEFDTKIQIYQQLDEVVQISYRWQCAIMWSIRQSAPHGSSGGPEGILTEAAKLLGISYRTAMRKAQIWEVFYQDPEADGLSSPKKLWAFDELNNTESWFRLALQSQDPEKTAEEAEAKLAEAMSLGRSYTPSQMKKDFGLQTDTERLREAEADLVLEREQGTFITDVVVHWESGLDSGKTPIIDFLRDYFKTDKFTAGGCRPKKIFNSANGEEIPF